MDTLKQRFLRSEYRSLSIILLGFILVFGCIQTASFYFNTRLQELIAIQTRASNLVSSWNRAESLNQELLTTYDLQTCSSRWKHATDDFSQNFSTFITMIAEKKSLADQEDLQLKVAKISMHWSVVHTRLSKARASLETYMTTPSMHTGNLLVDFGLELERGSVDPALLNLLDELRWTTSLSKYEFKKSLLEVIDHVNVAVHGEVHRIKISSLLLSAFILLTAAVFIYLRINDTAKSHRATSLHALQLAEKIKERDFAERQVRLEKEKLHALINAMEVGIYVVSPDYTIEFQSGIIETKYPCAIGKKCFSVYMDRNSPCSFCHMPQLSQEHHDKTQVETVEDDGNYYEFTFTPFIDPDQQGRYLVLVRDITERKTLELEATRSGYLSSIGELAAGVAHEINNPINGIISLTELIQDNNEDNTLTKEASERIIKEGSRIANIVSNLLSFAKDRQEEAELTSIDVVLSDAIALIGKQIRQDGTKLFVNLAQDLPQVLIKKQELQQVFLNVLNNSRQALNSKYPGPDMNKMLVIHGMQSQKDEREMVHLSFQDSGIGIKKEDMAKIGLPFFSTKPAGEGTGLGVSISRNIIEKAGGTFSFTSEPGKFTVVTIELPIPSSKHHRVVQDSLT